MKFEQMQTARDLIHELQTLLDAQSARRGRHYTVMIVPHQADEPCIVLNDGDQVTGAAGGPPPPEFIDAELRLALEARRSSVECREDDE